MPITKANLPTNPSAHEYGRIGTKHRTRGSALIGSLLLILTVTAMVMGLTAMVIDSTRQRGAQHETFRLRSHAESVATLTADQLWNGFNNSGLQFSLTSFRTYLGTIGIPAGAMDFSGAANLPRDPAGAMTFGGFNVDSIRVTRTDDSASTELRISVTASSDIGGSLLNGRPTRTVDQTHIIAGGEWSGLDFGLLANNVNCIMCHANIDSAERYYNSDPDKYDTFDRIKVGTLEHLLLRSSAESSVAGTLYVRGLATDKSGVRITDWASQTLNSMMFDSDGKLLENVIGAMTSSNLSPAGDPPDAMENLYLDYELDPNAMVDGYLPESFPPPFPDDGGYDPVLGGPDPTAANNRKVDDAEFAISAEAATGTIAGGVINLTSAGVNMTSAADLATAMSSGNAATLSGTTSGNVVLTGTAANPIILNGDVAIDGDLILQGYVKGEGTLLVRGNVYMPSDVMYLDGTTAGGQRTFGIASDGTTNSLGISAGGSMVAGDLFYKKPKKGKNGAPPTPGAPVTGDASGSFNFVLSEVALFNRSEWMKTQAFLPASGEDINSPASWTASNSGYQGVDYLPRYYIFTEAGSIPIYNRDGYYDAVTNAWIGKEHSSAWDSTNSYADPSNPNDPFLYDALGAPKAIVQSLTTADAWIPDNLLSGMMADVIANRTETGAFKLDAWLYTNNSIFGITGKTTPMAGQMLVNGGIVAADVGLLIPGNGGVGLQLNYDKRPTGNINLTSNEGITMTRTLLTHGGRN